MKNYIQDGKVLDFTAPAGGVVSGTPVQIGTFVVFPIASAAVGETFAGYVEGVFEVTKTASQAWSEGDKLYFDSGADEFTTVAGSNVFAGYAVEDVAGGAGDILGKIKIYVEGADSVIGAGAVDLANLAAGITPSHVAKFAGSVTWTGGGASLAETVTGAVAGDIIIATIRSVPTEAAYLVSAAPTTDTVTFTLSAANTSNDAIIDYVVMRAAA